MKREFINVPRDKDLLEFLADMKEKLYGNVLFFSPNIVENLKKTASEILKNSDDDLAPTIYSFIQGSNEEFLSSILLQKMNFWEPLGVQYQAMIILSDDIDFSAFESNKPTILYFFDIEK